MTNTEQPDPTAIAPEDDQMEEELEALPDAEKNADPLLHAKIRREVTGQTFLGQVEDIEVGKNTRDRLYLIKYDDGDMEHFTEQQVKEYLVKEAEVQGKGEPDPEAEGAGEQDEQEGGEDEAEEEAEEEEAEEKVTKKPSSAAAKPKAKGKAKAKAAATKGKAKAKAKAKAVTKEIQKKPAAAMKKPAGR